MKRLPVNLAAEPIEAVRRARRIVAIAATVLVTVTLLHVLVLAWVLGDDDGDVAAGPAVPVQTLEAWQQEVQELSAVADVQRARQTAAAVELGSQLLAWHSIPWGAIFADLEGLLPDRVRLEAVQPAIATDDEVRVSMTAAASDSGPLQDLLISLESSPRFRDVLPQREDVGQDGLLRMQLLARYLPLQDPGAATTDSGPAPDDPDGDAGAAQPAHTERTGSAQGDR